MTIFYLRSHQQIYFIKTIIIVVAAYVATKVLKRVEEQAIRHAIRPNQFKTEREEKQREDTLISILDTSSKVVIWLIAGFMILGNYGISIGPLLAGAGVVGLALGFGAQSLVKDYFAGYVYIGRKPVPSW